MGLVILSVLALSSVCLVCWFVLVCLVCWLVLVSVLGLVLLSVFGSVLCLVC